MAKYASEEFICIVTGAPGADLHHLRSQKSGGTDEMWNLLPLAHLLHVQLHNKGLKYMADKFPQIRAWLRANGWDFDPILAKWVHHDC